MDYGQEITNYQVNKGDKSSQPLITLQQDEIQSSTA